MNGLMDVYVRIYVCMHAPIRACKYARDDDDDDDDDDCGGGDGGGGESLNYLKLIYRRCRLLCAG